MGPNAPHGRAIGLSYHEGPFLDSGDQTEIQPGMVFTIEPGLYAPTWGSDTRTRLVIENGIEIPRTTRATSPADHSCPQRYASTKKPD